MAKADLKTKQTGESVEDFLGAIKDEQQRKDSMRIAKMMEKATGEKPKMWGPSIVGFGSVTLKYDSGRELDWMKIGFSPRKANLTLYLSCSVQKQAGQLSKLGKHKTGKGCLYIKRLSDVDTGVLEEIINAGLEHPKKK